MTCSRRVCALLLATLGSVSSASSQVASKPASAGITLWESGLLLGGIAVLSSAFDETTDNWVATQSTGSQGTARIFKRMGQPEVYLTVGGGLLATGLTLGDRDITRAGIHVLGSLALAGTVSTTTKFLLGRERPTPDGDADIFQPLSGNDAFPSGHTTMAFALAASLSDEIRRPWATVLLYGAATGTAWSRVHDHRHWLSDVAAGAMLGVASAKFVNGRWSILGLRAPQILPENGGVAISWTSQF